MPVLANKMVCFFIHSTTPYIHPRLDSRIVILAKLEFKEINVSVKNGGHSLNVLRNKVSSLIRDAKLKHFKVSVQKKKDSKALWKHFRTVNNGSISSENGLSGEIVIEGECFNDSQSVAANFNEYFTSVSTILNNRNSSNHYYKW